MSATATLQQQQVDIRTICPECGATKSISHPRCAACHRTRQNRDIRSLRIRRDEGLAAMREINAAFVLDDEDRELLDTTFADWTYDTRGIRERAASNAHTGHIESTPLQWYFENLGPHRKLTLAVPQGPQRQRRSGMRFPRRGRSQRSWRASNDLSSEFDRYGVGFDDRFAKLETEERALADLVALRRAQRQQRIDEALAGNYLAWKDVKSLGREISGLYVQRRELRTRIFEFEKRLAQEAATHYARTPAPEFYIDSEARPDAHIDDEPVSPDRLRSTLRDATQPVASRDPRRPRAQPLWQMSEPGRVSDPSDAWTEALLEDELRGDYPQLFNAA